MLSQKRNGGRDNITNTYIRVDRKKGEGWRRESATASGKPGPGLQGGHKKNWPQENVAGSAVLLLEKNQTVQLYSEDQIQNGNSAAFNGFLLHID